MRLYYSVADEYPAYRVDISELFGTELPRLGLEVEWFMMGSASCADPVYGEGQRVNLPTRIAGVSGRRGFVSRLLAWVSDAAGVARASLRRDIDAVQCRDKFFVSLVAALLCRLFGKPFFYWCSYPFPEHHQWAGTQRGGVRGRLQRYKGDLEYFLLYKLIMPLATHVFVQSDQMRDDIHAIGLPLDRMTPIPMGVPLRMLDWARRQKVPVVPGRVVYVGTLAAVRRLRLLIDSFAMVAAQDPIATLLIVGDGDVPDERRELETLTREKGLADRVRFTGFVPMEEAWTYAASAAVCLSPFYPTKVLRSTSPTKLVEYLALARPVVCNDHPEQSAIIRACAAGTCVPWSEEAFAQAILGLLNDPAAAEERAAAGPAWVNAHRTYPQLAAVVMDRLRHYVQGS